MDGDAIDDPSNVEKNDVVDPVFAYAGGVSRASI